MPEKPQNMTSKFRGVSFNSQLKKWKAVITVGRSQHFLGYFPDELEAAHAYDNASRHFRGPEAPVNFPGESKSVQGQHANSSGVMMMMDVLASAQDGNSLERLGTGMTMESVESVRDPAIEVAAVKATLAKQRGENVPEEFMIL